MKGFLLRAVLFDLDDTLIDHSSAVQSALQGLYATHRQFAEAGLVLAEFEAEWSRAHALHYGKFLRGELTHDEQRIARIRQVWNLISAELSTEEALVLSDEFLRGYAAGWKLFDDSLKCIQSLSGHKLGIITNGWGDQQRAKLSRCGISDRFEAVVISDEAGFSKPDAMIFELACRKLGVEAQECAFVGDLFELDVAGAKNAGMLPFWIRRDARDLSSIAGEIQLSNLGELHSHLR